MIIFCCKGYRALENKIDNLIYNKFKNQKKMKTVKIKYNKRININLNTKRRNNILKNSSKLFK